MKGYLDRIEENQLAVIIVDEIQKEFVIQKDNLPVGTEVNSYFELTIENDKITSIKLDEPTTLSEREKVNDLMSKLRSKSTGSKFKKK